MVLSNLQIIMSEEDKKPWFNSQITMPLLVLFIMTTGGWIWAASEANSEMNYIDQRVHKNSSILEAHIKAQAKTTNQIAIDIAKLGVESQHQQTQTRDIKKDIGKIKDLLQSLLIEARRK